MKKEKFVYNIIVAIYEKPGFCGATEYRWNKDYEI